MLHTSKLPGTLTKTCMTYIGHTLTSMVQRHSATSMLIFLTQAESIIVQCTCTLVCNRVGDVPCRNLHVHHEQSTRCHYSPLMNVWGNIIAVEASEGLSIQGF